MLEADRRREEGIFTLSIRVTLFWKELCYALEEIATPLAVPKAAGGGSIHPQIYTIAAQPILMGISKTFAVLN